MTLNTDISTALHLLEHVYQRVDDCDDPKLQLHTTQDLQSLITLLEDPVFRSIVTIQDSLTELNGQLGEHPSILPGDFDISLGGQLELSVPSTPDQPVGQTMYQNMYQDASEVEDQRVPVAPLLHSSSEDTSNQVTSPSLNSEVIGMTPIMTPTYAKEFQKVIETAARGRQTLNVKLVKNEGTSLGFSVVGLRSKDRGELGIFLQEIQPNGIAGSDGRLVEGDQILAIDGQPLDSNISHEQAISILQKARGLVELIVARSAQDIGGSASTDELSGVPSVGAVAAGGVGVIPSAASAASSVIQQQQQQQHQASPDKELQSTSGQTIAAAAQGSGPSQASGSVVERSNSAVSDASKTGDMVLNTEWAQVEVINLINDGSGLGFGIIGGRSTGVVVKTILPGGVADRDNRLQSGDHILQIGDVNLRGMGSEQVATVLRQSGTRVRLVVARPVEPTSPDYQAVGSHSVIVPTKILGDPDELDRHLLRSGTDSHGIRRGDSAYDNGSIYGPESELDVHNRPSLIMDATTAASLARSPIVAPIADLPPISMDPLDVSALPEMERFVVELKKDSCGLGITIAGYVCEKEELSGIFVKSISEGSAADLSKKIAINDRIVEVNGHSLQGYSNHEAVEVLRSTGQTVTLCLERYLRGPKYEQLQQAIAASELRPPQPGSPSIASLPTFPISADGDTTVEIEPEGESHTTVDSGVLQEIDRDALLGNLDELTNVDALLSDPSTELTPKIELAIRAKWHKIVGPENEIVVAQLKKFAEGSGLGISLEGTVDVENGQEVRPHHYIRSILPEGPVGQNGILRSGDELLEVNGYRLLGINHMEVVSVLKELPIHVRMVCGRNIASQDPLCPIDTAQHQAAFQTRSILGGSLQNLLPSSDRLVKAKSDGSLASTTTTATVTDASLNKMKSRSLEPLTGLAMWSSEPQIIELIKGERGLGFSILDYQDPMNPNETVIVIRSLVPGGVAQVDGQLIPGDRLLFVNDIALENATLDQAVQALKGAPKGVVRIGVAKPLPIPDSIAQRLAPICVVRRSKSLPDSDATDQTANLNDLLSSRSGEEDQPECTSRQSDNANQRMEEDLPTADNSLLGFVERLPRARRKSEPEPRHLQPQQHKALIKLTPFAEEQRRTKLHQASDSSGEQFVVEVQLEPSVTPRHSLPTELPVFGAAALPDVAQVAPCSTKPKDPTSARRLSLREQESIERVTRYLDSQQHEHQVQQETPAIQEVADVVPPLATPQPQQQLLGVDPSARTRRSSLKRSRHDEPLDVPSHLPQQLQDSPQDTLGSTSATVGETAPKKTVRICSVEETIRIDSFDSADVDEASLFPELQLVTAKILTAEEFADSMARRDESLRSPSKESTVTIATPIESVAALPIAQTEEPTRLLLPQTLKPSASDNAILRSKGEVEKVSERNIRPEILMDLSRAAEEAAADERALEEQHLRTGSGISSKRRLSRVSSDSEACRRTLQTEEVLHSPPTATLDGGPFLFEIGPPEVGSSPPSRRETRIPSCELPKVEVTFQTRTMESEVMDVKVESDEIQYRRVVAVGDRRWKSANDVATSPTKKKSSPKLRRWLSDHGELPAHSRPLEQRPRPRGSPKEEPPPILTTTATTTTTTTQVDEEEANRLGTREHSLIYQRQTLESPVFLDPEPFETEPSSESIHLHPAPEATLPEAPSTSPALLTSDFGPEESLPDLSSSQHSLLSGTSCNSPKREVQTQTSNGEHKSTQYQIEDLAELVCASGSQASLSRERLELLLAARFPGSPRREAEVQTELESKAVQVESPDLDAAAHSSVGGSTSRCGRAGFRRQRSVHGGSPKRDAHVQTGQDCGSTQCDFSEFPDCEEPGLARIQWSRPPRTDNRRSVECSVPSAGSSSPSSQTEDQQQQQPQQLVKRVKPPLILLVKEGAEVDMTVTHRDKDGNVVWAKHWGPERAVEIHREHTTSLGLSIVGGKVDLQDGGSSGQSQNVSGIFIKNVIPNSPAGRAGGLQIGDRIIEVDGVDLRNSTHERAVKAIQAAGNPVRLLVQSLVHLSPDNEGAHGDGGRSGARRQSQRRGASSPTRDGDRRRPGSPPTQPNQDGRPGVKRQDTGDGAGPSGRRSSMKKRAPSPPGDGDGDKSKSAGAANKYSSGESSAEEEEEDARMLEGNVYTKTGIEISRKSAANVKRSKAEIADDPEEEDEFGYTYKKVKKKYHNLKKPVHLVKLERDRTGVGISLAGHKDRNKMAVYICGLNPNGNAYKSGKLEIGDEILEVNGHVLQGRCHLNASCIIKSMPFTSYTIVVVRRPNAIDSCAVKQVTHFPTPLSGEDYSHFKGVRAVPIKKGTYGLGIMIIEGKHAEVGQGIFVSDIQVGSAAEQAGLNVGEMILAVNADSVMGATYDEATALLKKAEGVVTLTVCNPNQKQVAEEEERRARGEVVEPAKPQEKEKPKDEPQGEPKTCNIRMNKDTIIEVQKDKGQPIGFTVVGGIDTLTTGVFILDVFPDGAAGKDGRLRPGDRIVELNKEATKTWDENKAYTTVMRIVQGPIHMVVHRDERAYDEYEVELAKKPGKGSGLCLIGYKSGKGAYVSEVVPGGSAAENGRISRGDRIVSVGGVDLREAPVEDIALHVKVSNPVQLKLARYKSK